MSSTNNILAVVTSIVDPSIKSNNSQNVIVLESSNIDTSGSCGYPRTNQNSLEHIQILPSIDSLPGASLLEASFVPGTMVQSGRADEGSLDEPSRR